MAKGAKESRVRKVLKFPVRLLVKARDFYVNGMSHLSDQMRYDAVATMGCPAQFGIPRSFSVGGRGSTNSSSDYSELIRAASVTDNPGNRTTSPKQAGKGSSAGKMARSYSVGLGKIEEEKPDDLEEDYATAAGFSRSRSCAVSAAGDVLDRSKFQKPVAAAAVA